MTVYRAFSTYAGTERIIVVSNDGTFASVIEDEDGWLTESHSGRVEEISEAVITVGDVEYKHPKRLG